MSRRLTLPQLKKYDITQKVIEALADSESRAILFSVIDYIAKKENVILSTTTK